MMAYEHERAVLEGRSFPQEPAFGSPEAVAQAAEPIRGAAEDLSQGNPPDYYGDEAYLRDEVAPRLVPPFLVHRLPGTEGGPAEIISVPDLLAEVERLRAELRTEERLHLRAEGEVQAMREQREALADALLPYVRRNRAAVDPDRGIEASPELLDAEAALRKAGR